MTYAGFWRRVAASLIDSVIFGVLISLLLGPSYFFSNAFTIEGIISNSIVLIITVLLWWRFLGTPGKLLLGCQIVDADSSEPMTKKQAIIRYLSYFLSIISLMIGFLWVAWDKRKQGFHDKIANTVVLYNGNVDAADESQKTLDQLVGELR